MSQFFTQPDDFSIDAVDPAQDDIRDRVELAVLSVEPEVDLERVQTAVDMLDNLKAFVRDLEAKLRERLIAYITERGEFMIGDTRFYLGRAKETWCDDVPQYIRGLLIASEDVDPATGEAKVNFDKAVASLNEVLSANAVKPGAAKKLTPELFAKFFKTEEKVSLKKDAGPDVQRVNVRFLK